MAIVLADCPTCKERTDHETPGTKVDSDGRSYQAMTCRTCHTITTVYFDPNAGDFQINYEWPEDTDI